MRVLMGRARNCGQSFTFYLPFKRVVISIPSDFSQIVNIDNSGSIVISGFSVRE